MALQDNYKRNVGTTEDFTTHNQCDLTSSPGCYGSEEKFLHDLKMMWFDLYSCYPGKMDSSGFEQVCIKGGKISGFHNWLQFYRLEKQGLINYYSHSFDRPFTWDGYFKQVGSAIIGCSSEFDLAMYSLCYITRPGKQCSVCVCVNPFSLSTKDDKYIGSTFPATP
uniref:Uridylate-specific endoribonuclease n=1 Tax=Hucho hucho TaxID=62062 RepID=A0A4W5KU35_9TELE